MSFTIEKFQKLQETKFESCKKESGTAVFALVPEAAHALICPVKEQELCVSVIVQCLSLALRVGTAGTVFLQVFASRALTILKVFLSAFPLL